MESFIEFEQGADGVTRASITVGVKFPVVVERYDRERFQADGHFVPRMIDAQQNARDWDGPLVFVGTVFHELRDGTGKLTSKLQVLRVLADTPKELHRLMDLRIRESFFADWQAQQVLGSQAESFRLLNDEANGLRVKVQELMDSLGELNFQKRVEKRAQRKLRTVGPVTKKGKQAPVRKKSVRWEPPSERKPLR